MEEDTGDDEGDRDSGDDGRVAGVGFDGAAVAGGGGRSILERLVLLGRSGKLLDLAKERSSFQSLSASCCFLESCRIPNLSKKASCAALARLLCNLNPTDISCVAQNAPPMLSMHIAIRR